MNTPTPPGRRHHLPAILSAAAIHGLDPILVDAIVWQESGYNTDAFKHEADFWNRYLKGKPQYARLNPRRVSSSYGLMQVMYCRILEDKVAANDAWAPELLFIPENGLDIGCAFFKELLDWAGQKVIQSEMKATAEFVALAAYNGGRGGNDPNKNWPLRNGRYAQEVLAKRALLAKEYATI